MAKLCIVCITDYISRQSIKSGKCRQTAILHSSGIFHIFIYTCISVLHIIQIIIPVILIFIHTAVSDHIIGSIRYIQILTCYFFKRGLIKERIIKMLFLIYLNKFSFIIHIISVYTASKQPDEFSLMILCDFHIILVRQFLNICLIQFICRQRIGHCIICRVFIDSISLCHISRRRIQAGKKTADNQQTHDQHILNDRFALKLQHAIGNKVFIIFLRISASFMNYNTVD